MNTQASSGHRVSLPLLSPELVAANTSGPAQWRSLEAFAKLGHGPQAELLEEFPGGLRASGINRRQFLRLLAATASVSGLAACSRPPREQIVPTVWPDRTSGVEPLFFATSLTRSGLATGVLAKSYMGRPIKIEGNPDHPASLGATDVFAQAELLNLYDPQRSQAVRHDKGIATWDAFDAALAAMLDEQREIHGRGLRILTGRIGSPTTGAQLRRFMSAFPKARWHVHEAIGEESAGEDMPLVPVYDFAAADTIVSLGADFLFDLPGSTRYARDFSSRRAWRARDANRSRVFVAEPTPTISGAKADVRLPAGMALLHTLLARLSRAFGLETEGIDPVAELSPVESEWLKKATEELRCAGNHGVIVCGRMLGSAGAAAAMALNAKLGAVGRCVRFIVEPFERAGGQPSNLKELADDLAAGRVRTLLMFGVNPAYDAPGDIPFAELVRQVPNRIHAGLHIDETAVLANWHVPLAHELESWGDARAYDGTASLIQPLIAPLFGGRTIAELLAIPIMPPLVSGYELVRELWRVEWNAGAGFEERWRDALRRGTIENSQAPVVTTTAAQRVALSASTLPTATSSAPSGVNALELHLAPDSTVWDGRYATNAWLQELPKPISKLTWDNALLLNPETGARLGLKSGDMVRVEHDSGSLDVAVMLQPGQAADTASLSLGYGRSAAGPIGSKRGFDAYELRSADRPWVLPRVGIVPTHKTYFLVSTQDHGAMAGRELVQVVSPDAAAHPGSEFDGKESHSKPTESLYPGFSQGGPQWGMVIDLSACVGCNACIIACQAENNIAVVGKDQVSRGREMHWIRLDRYYAGSPEHPDILFQPVPCMHCENAPCELVCPVGATVHSSDGLNEMIYNRCIGTRYCSNNCPYKVRRFNFFQFVAPDEPEVRRLAYNPDVSVRGRGVMEKCTYCVQRIREREIVARRDHRPIRDGEILTACQQVCPAEAIVFGDLSAERSRVRANTTHPRNFALLGELNTRPRTTYLPEVRRDSYGGGA